MNEKLQEKMDTLKKENEKATQYLQNLEQEKNKVISECLIRNGRILELEDFLKEAI